MAGYKFIFRTNGGGVIGFGHVVRSIAIAEQLSIKSLGDILFVINDDDNVRKFISKYGYKCVIKKPEESFLSVLNYNNDKKFVGEFFIIDTKLDISDELIELKKINARIVLLDNSTNSRFFADLNIYPVAHFHVESLSWVDYYGKIEGGRDWVPIRSKFDDARESLRPFEERKSILVSMGGADFNNLTELVMRSLGELSNQYLINVVIGFSYLFKKKIYQLNEELKNRFNILENITDIEKLMNESCLAFTAMGTTIYELAFMKVPTIVISNYVEDEVDEKAYSKFRSMVCLGYWKKLHKDKITDVVLNLLSNKNELFTMSQFAENIINGNGAVKIANAILAKLK